MLQFIRRSAPFSLFALASCGPAQEFEENVDYTDSSEAIVIDTSAEYTITGVQSGKCVEIADASSADGARVQISTCTGQARQRFRMEATDSGFFRIRNVGTNKCLDVTAVSTADGAAIQQYSCWSGQNQQFSFTDVTSTDVRITARHSGKVVDVFGRGTADGTQLIQWPNNGGTNQHFRVTRFGSTPPPPPNPGTCSLPSSFRWTSSGPLAEPKSPPGRQWVSMKDFTVARQNNNYLVYATVWNNVPQGTTEHGWQGVFLQFDDFGRMRDATQVSKPGMVAPHLFYFSPKNIWVLAYQWGFKYATSTTPNNPNSWSQTTNLLGNNPTVGDPPGTGPIDLSLICDDVNCYIFFAADNGVIYRGSMPKGNFPGTFTNATAILRDSQTALFEGVEVYKIKGENRYLMIVEAAGDSRGVGASPEWGPRFFRAFTATSLGGSWTPMPTASSRATPFAGANNVTFPGGKWTDDISHGDLVREDPSERKEIDLCNLRMLYQGRGQGGGDYSALPYRPGLLTLVR